VSAGHLLEWDAASRQPGTAALAGGGAVGIYTCPDCELSGTVYVDPAEALSQLVKLLTVAHRDGVMVVSVPARQRTP
jgi:hypothetical protein